MGRCRKYRAGSNESRLGPGEPPRACMRNAPHDGPCRDEYGGHFEPDSEQPIEGFTTVGCYFKGPDEPWMGIDANHVEQAVAFAMDYLGRKGFVETAEELRMAGRIVRASRRPSQKEVDDAMVLRAALALKEGLRIELDGKQGPLNPGDWSAEVGVIDLEVVARATLEAALKEEGVG